MVKRSKGLLSRRTKRLKADLPITVSRLVRSFKIGDSVIINPKSHYRGVPPLRYGNRRGRIIEQRGRSYIVEILDGNKKKQIVSHPIHLDAS